MGRRRCVQTQVQRAIVRGIPSYMEEWVCRIEEEVLKESSDIFYCVTHQLFRKYIELLPLKRHDEMLKDRQITKP